MNSQQRANDRNRAARKTEGALIFFAVHAAILVAASFYSQDRGTLFMGVALAQAGLVGVWLAAATAQFHLRLLAAFAAAITILLVCALSGFINGWHFLIGFGQFLAVAAVLFRHRVAKGVVVGRPKTPWGSHPSQLTIRRVMAATVVVALFLALLKGSEDAGLGDAGLVLLVLVFGTGIAAIPLLACWTILGQPRLERLFASVLLFMLVAVMICSGIAWFDYEQTNYLPGARETLLLYMYEAAYLAVTFCYLRARGYQLVSKQPRVESASAPRDMGDGRTSLLNDTSAEPIPRTGVPGS